jgi:hypothetical protein
MEIFQSQSVAALFLCFDVTVVARLGQHPFLMVFPVHKI